MQQITCWASRDAAGDRASATSRLLPAASPGVTAPGKLLPSGANQLLLLVHSPRSSRGQASPSPQLPSALSLLGGQGSATSLSAAGMLGSWRASCPATPATDEQTEVQRKLPPALSDLEVLKVQLKCMPLGLPRPNTALQLLTT